ncbi:MAG: LptF/LptG family permease, partial [Planctomycetaceae bacterium]
MRTLDRYVVRTFLHSAFLWFVVLMSLRIVIDLFLSMQEFVKLDLPFFDMCGAIIEYYAYQSLTYIVELGGIIISASAVFTLAMMNHSNELTAMMASGVSLRRVAGPIVICAILMAGGVVIDREMIIPQVADKLDRDKDEAVSLKEFKVRLARDSDRNIWHSLKFDRIHHTMEFPVIVLRDANLQQIGRVSGHLGKPFDLDGKNGWIITPDPTIIGEKAQVYLTQTVNEGTIWGHNPSSGRIYCLQGPEEIIRAAGGDPLKKNLGWDNVKIPAGSRLVVDLKKGVFDKVNSITVAGKLTPDDPISGQPRGGVLADPRFTVTMDNRPVGTFLADSAKWNAGDNGDGFWELTNGRLFFPSDLDLKDVALRQSSKFMDYLSTSQLNDLLKMERVPDKRMAELTRHARVTDPVNIVILVLLSLPFILSRERNIKASAGLCLLASGTFYAFTYAVRYMGLPPE